MCRLGLPTLQFDGFREDMDATKLRGPTIGVKVALSMLVYVQGEEM
jgi:hypothetical protein